MSTRSRLLDELRELFRDRARDRVPVDPNRELQPIEPQPQPPGQDFTILRDEMLRELRRLQTIMGRDPQPNPAIKPPPIKAPPDIRLSSEDRRYYRRVHGFDPFLDVISIPNTPGYYKYEAIFDLARDPPLKEAGVCIGARVEVMDRIHNRIFFRRGNKESAVDCVHTAICTIGAQDALNLANSIDEDANNARPLLERAISTEARPIQLPPEEHFVSLKSYVAGIAEMGLSQVMFAAYHSDGVNPETLPFGFNIHLQRQLARALRDVAPSSTMAIIRDLVVELVQSVPEDWFRSRLRLLDEMYNIKACILTDPVVFDAVYSAAPCQELLLFGAQFQDLHPLILNRIARLGDSRVRASLVKNNALESDVLMDFAQDPLADVRLGVARHTQTPIKVLKGLTRDPDYRVRKAIAQNVRSNEEILPFLINDKDASVRASVQEHLALYPNLTIELLPSQQNVDAPPRTYNGVTLPSTECLALADLERSIGTDIPSFTDLGAHEIGFIARNDHVSALRITQTDLQTLPTSIGTFTYMQELDLSCNHLIELPSSLARLQQVMKLNLSANELSVIPPFFELWRSIIGPRKCEMLLLQRNQTRTFSKIPPSTTQSSNESVKYFSVLEPRKETTMIRLWREFRQQLRRAAIHRSQ